MNPKPFDSGYLDELDGHQIWYSQYGNPRGIPVVMLHGGPGSKSKPKQAKGYELDTLMNPPEHAVEAKIPVRVESGAADGYDPELIHTFSPEQQLNYLQQHADEADAYFDSVIAKYEVNPQAIVDRSLEHGHRITTDEVSDILRMIKPGRVVLQIDMLTKQENILHFVHDVMLGEKPDTDVGKVLVDHINQAFDAHTQSAHNKAA